MVDSLAEILARPNHCKYLCVEHGLHLVRRELTCCEYVVTYFGCPVEGCKFSKPDKSGNKNYKRFARA